MHMAQDRDQWLPKKAGNFWLVGTFINNVLASSNLVHTIV